MIENALVVDDDPIFCEIMQAYLETLGTKSVLVAHDAYHGLDTLTQNGADIDLAVLDLNMPEMDGIEFLSKMQELAFPGAIIIASGEKPVIINMAEYLAKQYGLNVLGTVKKPVTRADLEFLLASLGSSPAVVS